MVPTPIGAVSAPCQPCPSYPLSRGAGHAPTWHSTGPDPACGPGLSRPPYCPDCSDTSGEFGCHGLFPCLRLWREPLSPVVTVTEWLQNKSGRQRCPAPNPGRVARSPWDFAPVTRGLFRFERAGPACPAFRPCVTTAVVHQDLGGLCPCAGPAVHLIGPVGLELPDLFLVKSGPSFNLLPHLGFPVGKVRIATLSLSLSGAGGA